MTVKELRDDLSKFDGQKKVVVWLEDGTTVQLFEIEHVSSKKGNPTKLEDGTAGFAIDPNGAADWVFIDISPA